MKKVYRRDWLAPIPSVDSSDEREQSVDQPAPQQAPQIRQNRHIPHAEQAMDDPFDSVFGNDFPRRTRFERHYFLSGVGVLAFRDRIAEELGLQTASEPELEQIIVFRRKLSQPDGPQHKMPAPF